MYTSGPASSSDKPASILKNPAVRRNSHNFVAFKDEARWQNFYNK